MKNIKKIVALVLVAAMALCLFAGCVSEEEKIAELAGKWTLTAEYPEDMAIGLLENLDFYEEEIALVDLTTLKYVQNVEFTADKEYSFTIDADATKEYVREFVTGAFADMYEGRTALNDVYGVEFDEMSEEEFYQSYADLYQADSFDALIEDFTENSYDYDALGEPFEIGTYSIVGTNIMCTVDGEDTAESLGYAIDGDTLTLTYSDATEVYTRA